MTIRKRRIWYMVDIAEQSTAVCRTSRAATRVTFRTTAGEGESGTRSTRKELGRKFSRRPQDIPSHQGIHGKLTFVVWSRYSVMAEGG